MAVSASQWIALGSVITIDLTLALDNTVVLGVIAAKLPQSFRFRAILIGTIAAAVFRIIFASFASHLLRVFGLTLAGGFLLLWVAWKLWREIRSAKDPAAAKGVPENEFTDVDSDLRQAIWQILLADISMSLDNVLAVAGAAREHMGILVFGLLLSILSMGIVANYLSNLIERHRWISYVGLAIVLYVALSMILEGALLFQN